MMPGFSISAAQGKAIIVCIFVLHTFFTEPVSHVNKLFLLKLQRHRFQSLIVYVVPYATPVFFTFLTPIFAVLTTVYYFCSGYQQLPGAKLKLVYILPETPRL